MTIVAKGELRDELASLLVPLGYRSSGDTFNRERETGFVHVIEIRADATAFNLDLGVFITEVWRTHLSWLPGEIGNAQLRIPDPIKNEHTQIRTPVHNTLPGPEPIREGSWPLDHAGVRRGIEDLKNWGLPFLDELGSRSSVVEGWRLLDFDRLVGYEVRARAAHLVRAGRSAEASIIQMESMRRQAPARGNVGAVICSPRSVLIAAIILVHQGRYDSARAILHEDIDAMDRAGYDFLQRVYRERAAQMGIPL